MSTLAGPEGNATIPYFRLLVSDNPLDCYNNLTAMFWAYNRLNYDILGRHPSAPRHQTPFSQSCKRQLGRPLQ